jgi:uncharacterized membrane protein YqjE
MSARSAATTPKANRHRLGFTARLGWNDGGTRPDAGGDHVTSTAKPDDLANLAGPASPGTTTDASLGELVSEVSEHVSTLIRGELELAKLEIRSSVKNAGTGIVFFLAAAVVLVFSLTFGFIALAEGLVTIGLWRWAAYLAVFGFMLVLVGIFVVLGIRKVKRVRAPQRTIETSKDTVAYLKANTKRG